MRRATVLGLPVDAVDQQSALDQMLRFITTQETEPTVQPLHSIGRSVTPSCQRVITLNPEMVMAARTDPALWASIQRAALVVADGVGVLWAARLAGERLQRRVTGVDLLEAFAAVAARDKLRIFLLGARPGVAEQVAQRLQARHRGLCIVGVYAGSPAIADESAIMERLRVAAPQALFVAFGSPAQELWLARHAETLGTLGVRVGVGVGGAFDFIAGRRRRAPRWLRRAGLEWLFRLALEPWRWRRMLALPRFALAALAERLRPPYS